MVAVRGMVNAPRRALTDAPFRIPKHDCQSRRKPPASQTNPGQAEGGRHKNTKKTDLKAGNYKCELLPALTTAVIVDSER
jgi:hypothetical protein